jgi:hypothetical protein
VTIDSIGRVTRCSTRGFVSALRTPAPDLPVFGSFCKAEAQEGASHVIGLIYDISIQDDEFARQIAVSEGVSPQEMADSQLNRQVPVEISALAVGYRVGDQYVQRLPPQPPMTLAPVLAMTEAEIIAFTEHLDFTSILFSNNQIPREDLLAAALGIAAQARSEPGRRDFLIRGGKAASALLAGDIPRLSTLLRQLGESP